MIERGNVSIRGDVGPVDVTARGWNADRYEQAVASILDRLRATRVGACSSPFRGDRACARRCRRPRVSTAGPDLATRGPRSSGIPSLALV